MFWRTGDTSIRSRDTLNFTNKLTEISISLVRSSCLALSCTWYLSCVPKGRRFVYSHPCTRLLLQVRFVVTYCIYACAW